MRRESLQNQETRTVRRQTVFEQALLVLFDCRHLKRPVDRVRNDVGFPLRAEPVDGDVPSRCEEMQSAVYGTYNKPTDDDSAYFPDRLEYCWLGALLLGLQSIRRASQYEQRRH